MNEITKKIIKKMIANEKRRRKVERIDRYYENQMDREMRFVRRLTRRVKRLSNNYR